MASVYIETQETYRRQLWKLNSNGKCLYRDTRDIQETIKQRQHYTEQ